MKNNIEIKVGREGKFKNNTIHGDGPQSTNISVKLQFKHYAAASGAGFIGGLIASILANIICG
jgi:hypothetical protein